MRKIWIALWLAGALVGAIAPAAAQNTTGLVVSSCGTASPAFVAARPGPFTVDVNGNLCNQLTASGLPVSTTNPLPTTLFDSSGAQILFNNTFFPLGATHTTQSATATAATATATITAGAKTAFATRYNITGSGGVAGVVDCTLTNVEGGTTTIRVTVPAAATTGVGPYSENFTYPLMGSGVGQDVTLSCPTFGAGGVSKLSLSGGTL